MSRLMAASVGTTEKLSRRLLRNAKWPCRPSRKAAVTSLPIRTPVRSSDESEILRSRQPLTEKRRVLCRRAEKHRQAAHPCGFHSFEPAHAVSARSQHTILNAHNGPFHRGQVMKS